MKNESTTKDVFKKRLLAAFFLLLLFEDELIDLRLTLRRGIKNLFPCSSDTETDMKLIGAEKLINSYFEASSPNREQLISPIALIRIIIIPWVIADTKTKMNVFCREEVDFSRTYKIALARCRRRSLKRLKRIMYVSEVKIKLKFVIYGIKDTVCIHPI